MTITTVDGADCIGASVPNLPASLAVVAGYDTGSGSVPWTSLDWSRFPHSGHLHINQNPASDPLIGDVLDVESQAWTIPGMVSAFQKRKAANKQMAVYCSVAILTPLANALVAANLHPVEVWLANWNLSHAQAQGAVQAQNGPFPVKGVQWASPSSNPSTLLPGTTKTLAQANADLSVFDASWFKPSGGNPPPPPPPPNLSALLVRTNFTTHIVHSQDGVHWS